MDVFTPRLEGQSRNSLIIVHGHKENLCCTHRSETRGEVNLSSNDSMDRPIIAFNYFSEQDDLRCTLTGVRLNIGIGMPVLLTISVARKVRREFPSEAIRKWKAPTGVSIRPIDPREPCKMGRDEKLEVGSELRAHGIEGLRVAGASIMPTIVRGITNASTI